MRKKIQEETRMSASVGAKTEAAGPYGGEGASLKSRSGGQV